MAWLVVLAVLLAAPGAGAQVIAATSALPPGESGQVALTGLLNGTGSPHLYDQQQLYIDFRRKDAMLGQPAVTTQAPRPGVTIARDAYGVPSVTGATSEELWWGDGYATAEDRLFELEAFRRASEGTLAAVIGPSELAADVAVRRDYYTEPERAQMFASLTPDMQQRYEAYVAGINAYVDYVLLHPTAIPAEYAALAIVPTHFTVEDMVAIGVYLARSTPNGDGEDLTNMEAIQRSGPAALNRILPLRIAGQVATIPRGDGLFPSDPGRTAAEERAALRRSYAFVRSLPLPVGGSTGAEYVSGSLPAGESSLAATGAAATAAQARSHLAAAPLRPIHLGGSYMVAVDDPRTHHAILFNGPELGYMAPEELYETELHGPGIDVRGVTAPGAPVVAIGHNAHIAFGLTSGLSPTNALYAERLVPGHPDEYVDRGRVETMACRVETFDYRTEPTAILGGLSSGQLPQIGEVRLRLCRTNEGPVQARAGGWVYSRRYATWGREIGTLTGLATVDAASSVAQVNRALATVTWNENMMAVDDRGNIGYWHPGLLPIRPTGWDERLPYPGDGSADWRGLLPVGERPHVIDPARHWLANWNTLPSQGWTTGNDPASERAAGPFFRGAYLDRLAAALARHPSFAGMNALVEQAGSVAQQRPLDAGRLRAALRGAGGGAAVVLRTILAWNGSYAAEDASGLVDPGVAAWQTFKDRAQALAIAPLGAAGSLIGASEPNSEHLFDVSLGQAYALRTLSAAGYRSAAAATYAALVQRFGTADPAGWRAKRTFAPETALGAEQPPPMPFFDRGTFEEVTEVGP
jgi:penicillin amidase